MKRQVLTANAVEQSFTGLKQLIVSNLCTDRNKLTLYCEPRFVCVCVCTKLDCQFSFMENYNYLGYDGWSLYISVN